MKWAVGFLGTALATACARDAGAANVFEFAAEAGFAHRSLYSVAIEQAVLRIAPGVRGAYIAFSFPIGVELGRTDEGLRFSQANFGFLFEAIADRVRFGLMIGLGVLSIARVTSSDSFVMSYVDIAPRLSVDLVRFGSARYVAPHRIVTRPSFYLACELHGNTALVFGPSFDAGIRY